MKDKDLKEIIQEHKKKNLPPEGRENLNQQIFQKIEREATSRPLLAKGMIFVSIFMFFIFSISQLRHGKDSTPVQVSEVQQPQDQTLDVLWEDPFEEDDQYEVAIAYDFISLLDEV